MGSSKNKARPKTLNSDNEIKKILIVSLRS